MPSKESAISRCKGSSDYTDRQKGKRAEGMRKRETKREGKGPHLNIRMSVGKDLRPFASVDNEDSKLSNDITDTSLEIRICFII
jgi:hypothetical protein